MLINVLNTVFSHRRPLVLKARAARWLAFYKPGLVVACSFMSLILFPVGMYMLSGTAAAGACAGFAEPLYHPLQILLFMGLGVAAVRVPEQARMLPFCFLLMLGIGGMTDMALAYHVAVRVCLFVFVLLYALLLHVSFSRRFLAYSTLVASLGYSLGALYVQASPAIGSVEYFITGYLLSVTLVMAAGASLGIATIGYAAYLKPWVARVKALRSA